MSKFITANMLATGTVVFLGANATWVASVDEAEMYADANAAAEGLLQAQRDQERALIVDPFVTDKGTGEDGRPVMSLRDRIRAYGPTIRFQPKGSDLSV